MSAAKGAYIARLAGLNARGQQAPRSEGRNFCTPSIGGAVA